MTVTTTHGITPANPNNEAMYWSDASDDFDSKDDKVSELAEYTLKSSARLSDSKKEERINAPRRERYKLLYSNGVKYEGECINCKPDGKGKLTCEEMVIRGNWKQGKLSGEIAIIYPQETYYIDYNNGKPKFPGTLVLDDKSYEIQNLYMPANWIPLSGDIYDIVNDVGKLNGDFNNTYSKSCLYYANGVKYEGLCLNCKPDGEGKLTWRDMVVEGNWEQGKLNGKCTIAYPDRTYYREYKNGQLDFTGPNGIRYNKGVQNGEADRRKKWIPQSGYIYDIVNDIEKLSADYMNTLTGESTKDTSKGLFSNDEETTTTVSERLRSASSSPSKKKRVSFSEGLSSQQELPFYVHKTSSPPAPNFGEKPKNNPGRCIHEQSINESLITTGEIQFNTNLSYKGKLLNNTTPHIYGVLTSPTQKYEGSWYRGKFHGKGTITFFKLEVIYEGTWEHDLPISNGTVTTKWGQYQGSWVSEPPLGEVQIKRFKILNITSSKEKNRSQIGYPELIFKISPNGGPELTYKWINSELQLE